MEEEEVGLSVMLFFKVKEPLKARAFLAEVCHVGLALKFERQTLLLASSLFLTTDTMKFLFLFLLPCLSNNESIFSTGLNQ